MPQSRTLNGQPSLSQSRRSRKSPPRNVYRRRPPGKEKQAANLKWAVYLTLGFLVLGLFHLGLLLSYHRLLTSSWFCINDANDIKIEGLKRVSRETVLSQARLGAGSSLLALKPALVEEALRANPWIARAEVRREWPRRVHLSITEREPVALVNLGDLYYVDRQGVLFKPLSPGEPHDFPIITGLTKEWFREEGGKAQEMLQRVFRLLELLKETKPPLNLAHISEVHVDPERGLSLYPSRYGWRVDLGPGDDFYEKLAKFFQIWPALSKRADLKRVARINLTIPDRVVVSLKAERKAR